MSISYPDEEIVEPYSKLAYIYDAVMYHVDYVSWSRYIHKIIRRWHPSAEKILDISCGTGSLLFKLDLKKYKLFGFDASFEMLKVAKKKSKAKKNAIPLWQCDMSSFQLSQKVDVILSLYDSVNYIMDIAAWKSMLNSVYDGLNENGLFIFDICSKKNSEKFFRNYFERKYGKDYNYSRQSRYDPQNKIHSNRFEIHFNSEKKTFIELHKQKIFSIKEVSNLISMSRFNILGAYHGFTFKRGTERSLRIHFVLKKNTENA